MKKFSVNITFQIVLNICQLVVVASNFSILFSFRLNPLLIPFSPLRETYIQLPRCVSSARFPLTTKPVYLVPANEYLIGRISVVRYIPPTRLCGGHIVFMRDESAICEIPRIKGERPVSKGDNARAYTVLLKRLGR